MSRRGKKKTLWKPYSCLSFVKYFFLRYSKTKVCRTNWCREILYVLCNKQGFIKYQLLCWGSWPSMWTSDRITQVTEGCFRFQTEGKYGWARSITVQVWAVYACNKKFWFLYFFFFTSDLFNCIENHIKTADDIIYFYFTYTHVLWRNNS